MDQGTHTRLVLARHGEVAEEWRQRIYGDKDVPLSSAGVERSERVADALRGLCFDAVLSSGLERAERLAALVAGRPGAEGGPARAVERDLREIGRGAWTGMGAAEVERHSPGGWQDFRKRGGVHVPPGGETFEALEERVTAVLARLARAHPGGRVLVVAHRWVLTVALARTLGLALERGASLAVPPCGVAVIDWPVDSRDEPAPAPNLVALAPDRERLRALLSRASG